MDTLDRHVPGQEVGVVPGAESPTLVGVGASAGGLKALQQFFGAVRPDSDMAYVVILHLDPARESRMAELLQGRASIPVTQVTGPTAVEANHAYIIPPDQDLTVVGRALGLRDRGERGQHAPVDLFFRTLAEAYGPQAVGVVLSGTGVDGTAGIRAIREAGGVTMAQLPDEAEHGGMPSSAVSTGLVDRVLPVAQIPAELARLRRLPGLALSNGGLAAETAKQLAKVFATVRSRTGHDFSQYKRSTVLRRLERRLRFNDMTALEEYVPLLESSSTECRVLMSDLLISVSSFFRDPAEFEALSLLMPRLFETHASAEGVRVWVVGCATGEEAYSVAMVLSEHAATLADPPRMQVFATDIDERGYALARAGLYTVADMAEITPERQERFFRAEAGGYRVVKPLREMVLFAGHNVLHDPPFSRLDLISCRNLFIYLQEEAQERALETFHFALNRQGLLFLGAVESAGESGLFTQAAAGNHRLFRRNGLSHRLPPRATASDPVQAWAGQAAVARPLQSRAEDAAGRRYPYSSLHVRLVEEYAPPSVVVNEQLEVVHLSPTAGRFLRPGAGTPSWNALAMAPVELRQAMRTLLHHAFRYGKCARRRVRVPVDGVARLVNVEVRPEPDMQDAGRHALILFELVEAPGDEIESEVDAESPPEIGLEQELAQTRNLLESTIEVHDATVAELQTLNEELQSINEEQRAAAEELETGREEIQAINEELTTINQEHQSTIEELKRTNADLQNLMEATAIGTVFLDRGMRIRRYTPAAAEVFNFLPGDQGRLLTHITHSLDYAALVEDVRSVLNGQMPVEREVAGPGGSWYIARLNSYRSLDGAHEGAVLTFFDNTGQHRAAQELMETKLAAEAANEAKSSFLSTLSHEFRTPLNAIIGYADLLQLDGKLNEGQNLRVDRIKAGGWHLLDMIEEILSFAKLDGGHEAVEEHTVDARLLAREAGALAEPAAAAKGLELIMDLPDTPVPVVTDSGKARQILINLAGNAVKYTDAGQVSLRVRVAGEGVAFDVADTGLGIAPEDLEQVFERFWQVGGGSPRRAGGLGLGLAAAREYAALLRGSIEVVSELGRGSTFTLWLPVNYNPDVPHRSP
jgi:two-component system, chemotaxis family, CheB/CheR fusion protein